MCGITLMSEMALHYLDRYTCLLPSLNLTLNLLVVLAVILCRNLSFPFIDKILCLTLPSILVNAEIISHSKKVGSSCLISVHKYYLL